MPTSIDNSTANALSAAPASRELQLAKIDSVIERAAVASEPRREVSADELVKPVQQINDVLKSYGLKFDINKDAGRVITKIVDVKSGETIRQIPSDTVLHISERLGEVVGLLFKETA